MNIMMELRSKGSVAQVITEKSCVNCKATKTPLWRSGPAGPKSLCNACGIRLRKHLARSLNEENKPKGRKRKKSKIQSNRATASASTNCSTTHIAAGTSTSTTAKSASAAANGNASGRGRGRDSVLAVRFVVKKPKVMKNQKVVKKLRRYQRRRTNFRRTGFYFFSKKLRTLGEEEQAAVALLALSCGCGSVLT